MHRAPPAHKAPAHGRPLPESTYREVPGVTDAMVDAYLQANDAYWKRTDDLPQKPDKWRNGTPREATRESLRAALATLQGLSPAQATLTTVDSGALKMALNVLRRAGKDEVADALEATAALATLQALSPAQATLTDEQIKEIAETLPDPMGGFQSWGVSYGYRQDSAGEYTVPRVPAVAFQFARALFARAGAVHRLYR